MLVVGRGTWEDQEIPCELEDGDEGNGYDRNAHNSAKEQRDYLVQQCWCCAMAGWEGVPAAGYSKFF